MSPDGFFSRIGASPFEQKAFAAFDDEFIATAQHTNIVARGSLPERWERHYADSAQLFSLIPEKSAALLDVGSGAGFPGAVFGIMAAERLPHLSLTLCDSVGKKTAFLLRALEKAGLTNVKVVTGRVESVAAGQKYDVISARAVTALPNLIALTAPLLAKDGLLLFPKGRRAQQEVDEAREQWSFDLETRPSVTDPEASVLLIRSPKRVR